MSGSRNRFLPALVESLLAGALLLFGGLRAWAAQPPHTPPPNVLTSRMRLSPLALGMQQQLVLVNRLAAPEKTLPHVALPPRAPLALAPEPVMLWQGNLNPVELLTALRRQMAAPRSEEPAATVTAATGQPPREEPAARSYAPSASAASWRGKAGRFGVPEAMGVPVDLNVAPHQSVVVDSPVPLKRVSITDDAIAQAIVVSPTQVLVQGRAPGEVSLLLWDANARARAYTVRVRLDPQPLENALRQLFPQRALRVSASGNALVVTGTLPSDAMAKRVLEVAGGFSPHVVNDLSVDRPTDPGQVLLQVRFAEIDRSAVSQFGANLLSTGAGNTVGSVGTGQFGAPTGVAAPGTLPLVPPGSSEAGSTTATGARFGLNDLLNVFLFRSDANLGLTLQAMEQHNLLQILAEPNLVAMDGKEASFLAGGEFPFPVVQGQGSVNNVTIQFKPFGVDLHFKPTILADGTIDLQVAPEVSALDFTNALTVSGFLIPALSTRRASTELELRDGQSFVIAGLMDNRMTDNMSKIPGLGDIPILGKFFRSHNSNKSRTELMVVVTAHLVHASNQAPKPLPMAVPFLNPQKFDHAGGGR